MQFSSETKLRLTTYHKYLLIAAITILTGIEIFISSYYDGNIFSPLVNPITITLLLCITAICYVLLTYFLQTGKQEVLKQTPHTINREEIKEERENIAQTIVETRQDETQILSELQKEKAEIKHKHPAPETDDCPVEEKLDSLLHEYASDVLLKKEQNETDVLKYLVEKVEKLMDEFSIIIYSTGNKQVYMGMDAITIHLDRIANFYNDHDQFKGELTRYDLQLLHTIEFSDDTMRRVENFKPANTYLKEHLLQLLKLVYANKLTILFEKYEGMCEKVDNRAAKTVLQTILDKITEAKFSMEMLQKSVY